MTNDAGKDVWTFQGNTQGTVGLNAVVSWPKEDWGLDPTSMAEMRPGAYDIHERVRDMNRNGILASMCFPVVRRVQRRLLLQRARPRPRRRSC